MVDPRKAARALQPAPERFRADPREPALSAAAESEIRRALGRLQDEGWLTTLPRYGTFRSRPGPASPQGLT